MVRMTIIKHTITLPLDKKAVWNLLFDNTYVPKYMGCYIKEIDDTHLKWYMKKDNNDITLLEGKIIEKVPYKHLKIETFNPHRDYEEHHTLTVKYDIVRSNNETKLIITQTGFDNLPDGETAYQENLKGWQMMADNLKKLFI